MTARSAGVCVPWSQAEQLEGQEIAGFNFEEAV